MWPLGRGKRKAEEFSAEIEAHIELEAERLREKGLSERDAQDAARRAFGNVTKAEERFYESQQWLFWDHLSRDARYAARLLRKSPGFAAVAVITLALGIGANAIVFSIMNTFILRPLNVPDPASLYQVQHGNDGDAVESYLDYIDLRDRNRTFDDLAAWDMGPAGLDTGDHPDRVWIYLASGNYFDELRLQPYIGRFFHTSDEHGTNSAPYIVLTYAYWHTHFQDDRGVIGRVVQVNKNPFTIIGVAPPGFHGTLLFAYPDFFVPLVNQPQITGADNLNSRATTTVFAVFGHLKPGVSLSQATSDLNSIGSYLEKTYPREHGKLNFSLAPPSLYGDRLGKPARAFLGALLLLSGLILVAACANLGSLFAARAADRSREVALRLALGASRSRILRQLFTEAIMISLVGGALGLAASVFLLRGLSAWQPFSRFPMQVPVNPDANVYLVALLLTLASSFLFGAVPVRQVLRTDPYEIVKAGASARAGRRIGLREILLAAQIAICAVLVTSSFVAVRGLARSLHSDFGFQPANTLLLDTSLTMAGYTDRTTPAMQKSMIDAMQAIPRVSGVGMISRPPLYGGWAEAKIFSEQASDFRATNAAAIAVEFSMSPGYLEAARTSLLAGRDFSWHDDEKAPRVAVVNAEFARRIFGSVSRAIGSNFKLQSGERLQVVGVVEDGKYASLTEAPQVAIFLPLLQLGASDASLIVRSDRDLGQLAAAMQDAIRRLDPALPYSLETWYDEMSTALFAPRMATLALGVMGAIGGVLSITGIFGLAAYSVSKRKKELGIRMALGARRWEVLQAALGRAVKLLAFGSAAGLVLGILASRVLASIVFMATPRDPLVLAAVALAMALVGLLATWIPAQRALALDPLQLLREE